MRQTQPLFPHRCMRDQTYLLKTLFKLLTSKLKHDKNLKTASKQRVKVPRCQRNLQSSVFATGHHKTPWAIAHHRQENKPLQNVSLFFFFLIFTPLFTRYFLNRAITRSRRNKCYFAQKFPQIIANCIWYKNNVFRKNPVQYFQNIFQKSYNLLFLPREMLLCDFNTFTPQGTKLHTS